jgi:hypothetical protein
MKSLYAIAAAATLFACPAIAADAAIDVTD